VNPPHSSDTRTQVYWDNIADQWADGRHQLWRAISDEVNTRLLQRWLPRHCGRLLKTDVFDEAVGEGLFPFIASRTDQVLVLDISPSLLATAQQQHRKLVGLAGDVRSLPIRDATLDVVVSLSTLDHFATLNELIASVGNLRRALKPGGLLIVTLDNPLNPAVRLRNSLPFEWLNRIGLVPYYVGITCSPRVLADILRAAGFRVLDQAPVLHVPRVAAVALAALIDRTGSRRLRRWLLRASFACERLERLPSRYLSGHFLAMLAMADDASEGASRSGGRIRSR